MSASSSPENRGQWSSKLGFIMAAAGSAVGLGNIWRFPYMTGENGGAAFVMVYLACVVFIGLPLMWLELAFGRYTGKNPVDAFRDTGSAKNVWFYKYAGPAVGFLCLAACFFVLSFYGVIAGWTVGYIYNSVAGAEMEFEKFSGNPYWVIPLFAGFLAVTIYIVQAGIEKGIEKWSKILMPLLLVLVGVVIVRSVTLPGAMEGINWFLHPDFSKINGKVVLAALGQAFFSLSVGWGLMITYGSYMPKSQNIISNGFWVALMDTGVALMGGLMVIPAVFALGFPVDAGEALTFKTLPAVFSKMTGGAIIGGLFFLLLSVAALTSTISMLEVPVSYFVDGKRASRRKAAIIVGIVAFIVGIPSALSSYKGFDTFSKISVSDEATVTLIDINAANSTPEALKAAIAKTQAKLGPLNYSTMDLKDITFAVRADKQVVDAIVDNLQTNEVKHLSHSSTIKDGEVKFTLISVSGGKKAVAELRRALARRGIRIPEQAVKLTSTTDAKKVRTDVAFTLKLTQTNAVVTALNKNKQSLSYSELELKTETTSFLGLMDKYFGTLCLIIISLALSIYVGWMWDSSKIIGEIEQGYPAFTKPLLAGASPAAIWIFFIRFVCPIVIFAVLLGKFGVEIF